MEAKKKLPTLQELATRSQANTRINHNETLTERFHRLKESREGIKSALTGKMKKRKG